MKAIDAAKIIEVMTTIQGNPARITKKEARRLVQEHGSDITIDFYNQYITLENRYEAGAVNYL